MIFRNTDFQVPDVLKSGDFLLRPIRASDAELDFEAVMESREFLRIWEQSSWPEDDFTVEANRLDLENLERRHAERESFTYTVMNTAQTQCLGCVYMFPTDAPMFIRAQISSVGEADWSEHDAAVYLWIRKSRLADELDRRLLATLEPWFRNDWGMMRPLVVTSEQFEQQVKVIENCDLRLKFRMQDPNEPGISLAFSWSDPSS